MENKKDLKAEINDLIETQKNLGTEVNNLIEEKRKLEAEINDNLVDIELCEYYPIEIRNLYNHNAIKAILAQILTIILLFSIESFSAEALAASLLMGAAINVFDNRKPRKLQKELKGLDIDQLEQKQDKLTIQLAKVKNLLDVKQKEYNKFLKDKRSFENKLYNYGREILEEKSKVKALRK